MNKKLYFIILSLILVLVFSFSLIFYNHNEISKLEIQLEEKSNEIGSLENKLQVASEEIKKLKTKEDNLTILVMGDSLIIKSDWVQILDKLLEFNYPNSNYNVITSAKGGERAHKGRERFGYSVAVHKPQIIIIAYGTNDVKGGTIQDFEDSMERIVIQAKDLDAEVFINLIGPINIPDSEHYYEFNGVIRRIAFKHSITVINVLTPLLEYPDEYFIDG
ncbi:unnamed protein product, partial [marine sediment metagenome]